MSAPTVTSSATRLLAGVSAGATTTLAEHLAFHGALPRPEGARKGRPGLLVPVVEESGLRGRGGGWFPTGRKMRAVTTAAAARRGAPFVIGNGMEGEPASTKDAVLLTLVPHLVLDGLVLAAQAVGAKEAVIAVHRDSPSVAVLERALDERLAATKDPVKISIATPPARYVASEESALAHWVGDGVALPRSGARPFEKGVGGRPTLVQNAETLAHLALIARHGAAWFRELGSAEAPGTALVSVSGGVAQPGVVEVATGTSIAHLLERCGGATAAPVAFLTGGYGGAWMSGDTLDLPWAPEPVRDAGGVVGAGILVALPADRCGLVETARVARWMAGESAGQCGPCRFGLPSVADDLEQLVRGTATAADLTRLRTRLGVVRGRGACKHPDGVVRLIATALDVFADDTGHHLRGRCVAGGHGGILPVPASRPSPVGKPGKEWR